MTLNRTLVLAAAAVSMATGLAHATTTAIATGNWSNPSIWNNGVPSASNPAVINAAYTVTVDLPDARTSNLQIANGGVIQIPSEKMLTIGGGYFNSSAIHQVEGTFVVEDGLLEVDAGYLHIDTGGTFIMQGDTPRLQIDVVNGLRLSTDTSQFLVASDAAIGGTGTMFGNSPDALVVINVQTDDDVQFTVEPGFEIYGKMTFMAAPDFSGKGRLENKGLIRATSSEIKFDSSLHAITDAGSCATTNWQSDTGASLRFERGASLGGSFQVNGSLVVSGVSVATSGRKLGSGSVSTPSSGSFSYAPSCQ